MKEVLTIVILKEMKINDKLEENVFWKHFVAPKSSFFHIYIRSFKAQTRGSTRLQEQMKLLMNLFVSHLADYGPEGKTLTGISVSLDTGEQVQGYLARRTLITVLV